VACWTVRASDSGSRRMHRQALWSVSHSTPAIDSTRTFLQMMSAVVSSAFIRHEYCENMTPCQMRQVVHPTMVAVLRQK
jgi:hypothetical protein